MRSLKCKTRLKCKAHLYQLPNYQEKTTNFVSNQVRKYRYHSRAFIPLPKAIVKNEKPPNPCFPLPVQVFFSLPALQNTLRKKGIS